MEQFSNALRFWSLRVRFALGGGAGVLLARFDTISRMSSLGIDIGNESSRIGVVRQGGVDVVLNEESKRETPTMISFGDKQRFLGSAAAASAMMNLKNTVWQVKRLVGRKFYDPEVQRDLKLMPCAVTESHDGWPMLQVSYLGEQRSFKPTEVLGMLLANLKQIASRNAGIAFSDCVLGVPAFMTDAQRRGYLDAAAIAGLKPLRLIHETTAAALYYGIYKTDLPSEGETYVAFVDIGHAHTQVAVASFRKGRLKILSYAFDRCLGGRDFDEVLFLHFESKFSAQYKIDILSNARACQRLRAACEKVKKVLSANMEGILSIECLMEEKDVKGHITRDEFEKLSSPLLQRMRQPCEKALAECGVADNIHAVEVIGSGSRVPAVAKVLTSVFKKDLSRTLNASECVARGCALQSAMLSPTFKVRNFEVQEQLLFPISLSWTGPAATERGGQEEGAVHSNSVVFQKGTGFPLNKVLRFVSTGPTFSVSATYADPAAVAPSTPASFANFTAGPFSCNNCQSARVDITFSLNIHGVLTASSASLVVDEELPNASADGHVREGGNVQAVSSKESARRYRQTSIPIAEAPVKELSESQLQNAIEKVYDMELQDRAVEEIKEMKNALEAFVYDMRKKFFGSLQEYVSDSEKKELLDKLQQTETWLYEGGEDESKEVYSARLNELRKCVDTLEERQREEQARGFALTELLNTINKLRAAAHSHKIDRSREDKVLRECNEAESWSRDLTHRQAQLPRYARPIISSDDIKSKTNQLARLANANA